MNLGDAINWAYSLPLISAVRASMKHVNSLATTNATSSLPRESRLVVLWGTGELAHRVNVMDQFATVQIARTEELRRWPRGAWCEVTPDIEKLLARLGEEKFCWFARNAARGKLDFWIRTVEGELAFHAMSLLLRFAPRLAKIFRGTDDYLRSLADAGKNIDVTNAMGAVGDLRLLFLAAKKTVAPLRAATAFALGGHLFAPFSGDGTTVRAMLGNFGLPPDILAKPTITDHLEQVEEPHSPAPVRPPSPPETKPESPERPETPSPESVTPPPEVEAPSPPIPSEDDEKNSLSALRLFMDEMRRAVAGDDEDDDEEERARMADEVIKEYQHSVESAEPSTLREKQTALAALGWPRAHMLDEKRIDELQKLRSDEPRDFRTLIEQEREKLVEDVDALAAEYKANPAKMLGVALATGVDVNNLRLVALSQIDPLGYATRETQKLTPIVTGGARSEYEERRRMLRNALGERAQAMFRYVVIN